MGALYAANTFGAIAGAILVGGVLVPLVGVVGAMQTAVIASGFSAVIALRARSDDHQHNKSPRGRAPKAPIYVSIICVTMAALVKPFDVELVAYGHELAANEGDRNYDHIGDGRSASVAVSRASDHTDTYLHINGKVVASNDPIDMRLQYLLGHLPALAHPEPKSVLIVGMGSGVTAGAFVAYPSIERIVICEIEPLVATAARAYFRSENNDVLNDPRVEVIFDDGRHFLSTTDERFDIITSDPIHPWVSGSAALYSASTLQMYETTLSQTD